MSTVEVVHATPIRLAPLVADDELQDDAALSRHLVTTLLDSRRPATRRTTASALDTLARIIAEDVDAPTGRYPRYDILWHRLGVEQAMVLAARVDERYAPATARKLISILRQIVNVGWRLEIVEGRLRARILDALRNPVEGESLLKGRQVPVGEVRAVFAAAASDITPAGRRDAAVVAVLAAGLRRAEAAALQLADLDQSGWTLKVSGKRRRQRTVHLSPGSIEALRAYLFVRGDVPGPLLCRIKRRNRARTSGGDLKPGTSITGQTIEHILTGLCQRAHVRNIDPHDLRRTLISNMLDDTDITTVAKLVGHRSVTTTQRYDRRPDIAARDAMSKQHVPYVAPGGAG